jgi:hypothetical protein
MSDFEIPPPNPMQQIQEIVELAHQCLSMRKAYVNLDLFGGSDKVCATIITDFSIIEYAAIHSYYISPNPNAWQDGTRFEADMDNQAGLQSIIDRLKEVLA